MSSTRAMPSRPETARARDAIPAGIAAIPHRNLPALTALRFVAATLIVLEHSAGRFGVPADLGGPFLFDQAVSFFFVLSGFILTYVHPVLPLHDAGRFLRARLARIWPGHLVAFALLFLVAGTQTGRADGRSAGITLANLLLIHAWIPLRQVFYSYNTVSWSISTEWGFYLLFPVLIRNWERTWWRKLLLAFLIVCALITIINLTHLPAASGLRETGLLYINPLGRLFEFTLGMATARLFARSASRQAPGRGQGTARELLVLAGVVGCMAASKGWAEAVAGVPWIGMAGSFWLREIGSTCLAFATLIFVMARERGWVSSLLSRRPCVLLGEISFAVYLLHPILMEYYTRHLRAFLRVPAPLMYALFWMALLLGAHLVHRLIENPARRLITGIALRRVWREQRIGWWVGGEVALCAALMMATGVMVARAPLPDSGHIDAVACTSISGWAWAETAPNDAVMVTVWDGTTPVGALHADEPRPDLATAGFGNGAHGFSYTPPISLRDGYAHTIRVTRNDGEDLNGSPRTLTCNSR